MISALAICLLSFFWPLPPLPYQPWWPKELPSRPVGLLRSQATFKALGWRAQWEWQGAQACLERLGVDFEVVEPGDLNRWNGRILILPNVRNISQASLEAIQTKRIPILATYMTSYRKEDNDAWSPNNFALAEQFGADFKSWVGSGSGVDHIVLKPELGGGVLRLGRRQAMLVKPHANSEVLASWGNSEASIVQGPAGIYVGENIFAPENCESNEVLELIASLIERLAPGLAGQPRGADRPIWPFPPVADLKLEEQQIKVGIQPLTGAVSFRARSELWRRGEMVGTTWRWDGKPARISGLPYLEILRRRPNGTFSWSAYRGTVEVGAQGKAINLVNLQQYLAGVVPGEVPAYFPNEALKAMAVVARTYSMAHLGRHQGYDVCSDVHCQVYQGLSGEAYSTSKAVNDTQGLRLSFEDKPIDALFFAVCGGMGAEPRQVWPKAKGLPYLEAKQDIVSLSDNPLDLTNETNLRSFIDHPPPAFCSSSGRFRWRQSWNKQELREILSQGLKASLGDRFQGLESLKSLKIVKRAPSGRVNTLEIRSPKHTYLIEGDAIRWLWSEGRIGTSGLQSTLFYIDDSPGRVTVVGGGWGHGLGLCQEGAAGRAKSGEGYKAILEHYYPKAKLIETTPTPKAQAL